MGFKFVSVRYRIS